MFHKSPSSVIVSTFYFVTAYMLKEILPWISCSWKEILEGSKLSLYWNLDLNRMKIFVFHSSKEWIDSLSVTMCINSQGTVKFFHNVFWGQRVLTSQRKDTQEESYQVGAWVAVSWTVKLYFKIPFSRCMIYLHNLSQPAFLQVAVTVPFQCLPDFRAGAMTACSDGLQMLRNLWTTSGRAEEQQEVRMIF